MLLNLQENDHYAIPTTDNKWKFHMKVITLKNSKMKQIILLEVLLLLGVAISFTSLICSSGRLAIDVLTSSVSQNHNNPSSKLLDLQTSLANRMDEHHNFISEHLQNVDANLALIAPQLEKSVSNVFSMQNLIEHLPEAILNSHFASMADHFKASGQDGKMVIAKSMENITQNIIAMEEEMESMELFVKVMTEKVKALQEDISKGLPSDKEKMGGPVYFRIEQVDDDPTPISEYKQFTPGETSLVHEWFKHHLNATGVFTKVYINDGTHLPEGTPNRARYEAVFNATLPTDFFNDDPCDYSCNTTAEVQYENPGFNDTSFQYEYIDMNCTASAPGEAKGVIGTVITGEVHLSASWVKGIDADDAVEL